MSKRAVIVEDEKRTSDVLLRMLNDYCPDIEVVAQAMNVEEGIEKINQLKPNLVFLDVMMPDGSGFDVLERVKGHDFQVIFTTATDKFAIKAIKYSALDYLLKPIDPEELQAAVKKAEQQPVLDPEGKNKEVLVENVKSKSTAGYNKITLPTGSAYEIVSVSDILHCEAQDNYTRVYLKDGKKYLVSGTLKHYEELLADHDFARIHHSHLVNMQHVMRFVKDDGGHVILTDGSEVEVSRRKKEEFLKRLK